MEEGCMACVGWEVVADLRSNLQTKVMLRLKRKGKWGTKRRLRKCFLGKGGAEEGIADSSMAEIQEDLIDGFFFSLYRTFLRSKIPLIGQLVTRTTMQTIIFLILLNA